MARTISTGFSILLLTLGPVYAAAAQELVAVRPGLMCVSPQVLGRLTLPDGSSRANNANSADQMLKLQGGCLDIVLGSHVKVVTTRRNTSVIHYDVNGVSHTYYVANIDFSALPALLMGSPSPNENNSPSPASDKSDVKGGHDFSVGIIQLGSSFDAAKAKFAQGYKLYTASMSSPDFTYFVAFRDDQQERYAVEGIKDKVIYVAHDQIFGSDNEPLSTTVLAAAEHKFGSDYTRTTNALINTANWSMFWIFDPLGKVSHDSNCENPRQEDSDVGPQGSGGTMGIQTKIILGSLSSCGKLAEVLTFTDQKDQNLVSSLRTSLFDHDLVSDYFQQAQDAQNTKNLQRERQAAQKGPTL